MIFERAREIGFKAVFEAARFCAKIQSKFVLTGHSRVTMIKDDRSPVTIADFGSQAIIKRILKASFPKIKIVAEEQASDLLKNIESELAALLEKELSDFFNEAIVLEEICEWIDASDFDNDGMVWLVDPIDGTKGFLRGGQYAIALALLLDGKRQMGFLGCPNLPYNGDKNGCIFMAETGNGARQIWLEDPKAEKDIKVSSEREGRLLRFVESVEEEHADHEFHIELSNRLGMNTPPLRIDSQAKYAIVARGESSAYLRLPSPMHPNYIQKAWDHAAGSFIVEEAGGRVTDAFGKALDFSEGNTLKTNRGIVATNGECHDLIIDCIHEIAGERMAEKS